MPFYEYQCSACGHHHEELQRVGDRALRKCPACGRSSLRRLVSAPVFRLKGGGWYETDFKSEQETKRNLAGEREPPQAKDGESAKPKDSKPEAPAAEKKPAASTPKPKARPAARTRARRATRSGRRARR